MNGGCYGCVAAELKQILEKVFSCMTTKQLQTKVGMH